MVVREVWLKIHSWVDTIFKQWKLGVLLGAVFCGFAGLISSSNYLEDRDARQFHMWQQWYAPAVSIACGYGLSRLDSVPGDPLDQFLRAKNQYVECEDIPQPDNISDVGNMPSHNLYLQILVGNIWKITGPDWNAVKYIISFLFALMAIGAFLVARSVIGSFLSIFVTLLFIFSPENLELTTRLRDLGKAPFILLSAAAMLWSIKASNRSYLLWVAGIGFLIGIGIGFRMDVAVMLPLSIILVMLLAPKNLRLVKRMGATFLLIGAFLFAVIPLKVLVGDIGGNTLPHVTILGLSSYSDNQLGLQPGSYAWGVNYKDHYVSDAVSAYAAIEFPDFEKIRYASSEYETIGMSYLLEMLKTFPADMFLRVGASTVSLTEISIIEGLHFKSADIINKELLLFFVWLSFVGIASMEYKHPRKAIGFGLIYLFLASIVALQFAHRHYFYVELFSLIALAGFPSTLAYSRFRISWKKLLFYVLSGMVIIGVFQVVHASLVAIQNSWLSNRLEQHMNSPRKQLNPEIEKQLITYVRFPRLNDPLFKPGIYPAETVPAYPIVMTIDQTKCGANWRFFRIQYGTQTYLDDTFWLQDYPREKFVLLTTQYTLPDIQSLNNLIEVTIPVFRGGKDLREIQLSIGMENCVVDWARLYSKDAAFNLMNWIVDQNRALVPYTISLSKPRLLLEK